MTQILVSPSFPAITYGNSSYTQGVSFTVTASSDSPPSETSYKWTFESQTYSGRTVQINPSASGASTLELTVTNMVGSTTTSKSLTVLPSSNGNGPNPTPTPTTENSSSSPTPTPSSSPKSSNAGAIAAGILVPLVVIGLIVGAVFFMKKKNIRLGTPAFVHNMGTKNAPADGSP